MDFTLTEKNALEWFGVLLVAGIVNLILGIVYFSNSPAQLIIGCCLVGGAVGILVFAKSGLLPKGECGGCEKNNGDSANPTPETIPSKNANGEDFSTFEKI